jgi:adenylate cyclase
VRTDFLELQQYNHRLLQISVYNADGRTILTSSAKEVPEPTNRIGAAYAVEGKSFLSDPYFSTVFKRYVLYISVPIMDADGNPMGALGLRYDIQDKLGELFASTRFGATGYAVLLDHDGKVLAHHDQSRIGADLTNYPAYRDAAAGHKDWVVTAGIDGVKRLYAYRPLRSPATTGERNLILLTAMDLSEVMEPIVKLRNVLVAVAAVLCCVWAFFAWMVARHLTRPLASLLKMCIQVRDGDLSAQAPVTGRDEINVFSDAFNQMVAGLRERDRVKQIFGRYVSTQVSERVLKHGIKLGGERKEVTMLFADIRNFTNMSESMQPEQVVELLNEYFSEMVQAVVECGGVLDKFIGDGMLAVFGSMDDGTAPASDHRKCAVNAGLRMKAKLAKINGEREMRGQPPIHIGIGIHTDQVVVGHIGSRDKIEHTVIGDGVNTCSRVESMNKELGTTLLITEQTHAAVAEVFECRAMPETKVKGKSRALKVFEVLSARQGTPAAPTPEPKAPPASVAA